MPRRHFSPAAACHSLAEDVAAFYATLTFPITSFEAFQAAWEQRGMERLFLAGMSLPRHPACRIVTRLLLAIAGAYLCLPSTIAFESFAVEFGSWLSYFVYWLQPAEFEPITMNRDGEMWVDVARRTGLLGIATARCDSGGEARSDAAATAATSCRAPPADSSGGGATNRAKEQEKGVHNGRRDESFDAELAPTMTSSSSSSAAATTRRASPRMQVTLPLSTAAYLNQLVRQDVQQRVVSPLARALLAELTKLDAWRYVHADPFIEVALRAILAAHSRLGRPLTGPSEGTAARMVEGACAEPRKALQRQVAEYEEAMKAAGLRKASS